MPSPPQKAGHCDWFPSSMGYCCLVLRVFCLVLPTGMLRTELQTQPALTVSSSLFWALHGQQQKHQGFFHSQGHFQDQSQNSLSCSQRKGAPRKPEAPESPFTPGNFSRAQGSQKSLPLVTEFFQELCSFGSSQSGHIRGEAAGGEPPLGLSTTGVCACRTASSTNSPASSPSASEQNLEF